MSWLYTVLFSGLMFSGQGSAVPVVNNVQSEPVVVRATVAADETEKFEQTYPLSGNGRVNVSNVNGSITVEAWDRNEVKIEYTKIADSKERLADVQVKIDARPDSFSAETDYGDSKGRDRWRNGGKLVVEIRMMVPRGAVLNEIETVNGSVSVSNFTNITKISAVNGSVTATNLRGTAKLSTVNGEVTADFDRLESGSKISLETVNGRVNLVIPSDSNATVKADSLNGNISNDFGLPVRKGKYVGRDLYGKIGTGEIPIRLESVNGGLSVTRKNDGKSPSPAVNLLPQKEKEDEDWDKDNDDESMMRSAKIDKEVASAAKAGSKAATKQAEKAMAEAQVQLKQLQPEIAKITAESIATAAGALAETSKMLKSGDLEKKIAEADMRRLEGLAKMADASFFNSVPRVEKKSESFTVKGTPKVTVEAKGCSVTVRGWDKSEVQYRVVQFSEPRNREPLSITENHSDSTVNITIANPDDGLRAGDFTNDRNRVRVEIFVPRKSNLKISTNGEIRLDGVSGDIELSGSDEPINVRDVDGTLKVSNSDGRIRVIGFRGDIDASTSDGSISLEGDFKSLSARASDGSIMLTLPENASADLTTNSENLRGDGIQFTRISGDETRTKYRIGNGGSPFQIHTDGEISIRGAGTLKESL